MTKTDRPQIELMGSRQFPNWLAEQGVSLAFTTYQTGKFWSDFKQAIAYSRI